MFWGQDLSPSICKILISKDFQRFGAALPIGIPSTSASLKFLSEDENQVCPPLLYGYSFRVKRRWYAPSTQYRD